MYKLIFTWSPHSTFSLLLPPDGLGQPNITTPWCLAPDSSKSKSICIFHWTSNKCATVQLTTCTWVHCEKLQPITLGRCTKNVYRKSTLTLFINGLHFCALTSATVAALCACVWRVSHLMWHSKAWGSVEEKLRDKWNTVSCKDCKGPEQGTGKVNCHNLLNRETQVFLLKWWKHLYKTYKQARNKSKKRRPRQFLWND